MLNPYEAQEVYHNPGTRETPIVKTMIECLRNRIASHREGVNDANRTNQPIAFLEEPIPPERCNNYESIIDYILFGGMGFTYRTLSNFSDFFSDFFRDLWYFETTPTPLDIFNFFISLPYVVFSFEKVIDYQPTGKANSSAADTQLGEHFQPIFSGLHERNDMERLMNRYYRRIYRDEDHDIFLVHLLSMLQRIYSQSYEEDDRIIKSDIRGDFKSLLYHMCRFITYISEEKINIYFGDTYEMPVNLKQFIGNRNYPDLKTSFSIYPDLIICDERDVAKMIIETKQPPMFEHFNVPPFDHLMTTFHEDANGDTVENNGFVGMLKQLLVYMIGYNCLRGILTDGYTLFLVEIDVTKVDGTSNINYEKYFINNIPLRLSTFDCKSRYPSYLQVILYFLMAAALDDTRFDPSELFKFEVDLKLKSIVEREEGKDEDEEPRDDKSETNAIAKTTDDGKSKKRRLSAGEESTNVSEDNSKRPLVISWEDQPEVLQNIYYAMSHVVKVKAKYVKSHLLESIDDDDDVVVKIFDPNVAYMEKSCREDIIDQVNRSYIHEKKSAQRLVNIKVDTLYMKQVYGSAVFNFGFGRLIKGKFILSRYVDSSDLPITKEIFNMSRQQLDIIHNAGIVHGDIRKENILFDQASNKVYIIDFGSPEYYGIELRKVDDITDLKIIFRRVV